MVGECMKMKRKDWIENLSLLLINVVDSGNVKYQYNNGSPTVLIKSPLSSLQLPQ
jgi:hypothetical protein